jgi:uncharacterized low-complexity protein
MLPIIKKEKGVIMAKNIKKPLTAALGAAFLASAVPAVADVNPFEANPMSSGYDLVNKGDAEGKCGEGKCGEGKCGEGKCGEDKGGEGKCGEGKCGGDK